MFLFPLESDPVEELPYDTVRQWFRCAKLHLPLSSEVTRLVLDYIPRPIDLFKRFAYDGKRESGSIYVFEDRKICPVLTEPHPMGKAYSVFFHKRNLRLIEKTGTFMEFGTHEYHCQPLAEGLPFANHVKSRCSMSDLGDIYPIFFGMDQDYLYFSRQWTFHAVPLENADLVINVIRKKPKASPSGFPFVTRLDSGPYRFGTPVVTSEAAFYESLYYYLRPTTEELLTDANGTTPMLSVPNL